ncbi:unnamed protein product [Cochlearia groenlandica]
MAGKKNSAGFVTDKNVNRTKQQSIDTNESTSSRFSADSQKPRIGPPPGTYHIQLPKDQIYRVPPPENADRYEYLSRRKSNRTKWRRCVCYFLAALLVLVVLAALVAGILFLVYRPQKPYFAVIGFSVAGLNLTSSSPISPVIETKVRFQNGNGGLGLIYKKGAAAEVFYGEIKLGDGEFTAFEQPASNVTVMETELKGSRLQITSSLRKELTESQKKGKVPFEIKIKAPVKFKIDAVTTWTMTVRVDCKITVDKLTAEATVITENCDTGLCLFMHW